MEETKEEIKDQNNLAPDEITPSEYRKWLSRIDFAVKYHKKEIANKYKIARKRYNSEIRTKGVFNALKPIHDDINLLFNTVRNFIGSIFFRNPEVDLTSREDMDEARVMIENLEQMVNDQVKDNRSLKRLIRSAMVDESLAGLGAVYIDYKFYAEESDELVDESIPGIYKQEIKENEVCVYKIRPENIIRPPYQQFFSYKTGPYLGYVDIVSLEELRKDFSIDQSVVSGLKGKEYKDLIDRDFDEHEREQGSDDIKYVKCYFVFIKDGDDLKRLVLAADEQTDYKPLAYEEWDKGHESYPIHIWAGDEPCEGFIPPSEAWRLESVLQIIDYIFEKLNKHLKRSSTRTFVQTGEGGVRKAEIQKVIKSADLELIGIQGVAPGVPLSNSIYQVVDQSLGKDHMDMFILCRQTFDQISRQPSFAKSQVINNDKTATETQAIQQADNTINGDYIDKFKDFWIDLLRDWAFLLQKNFQGQKTLSVRNKMTGEDEEREATIEDIQGEFNCDVNVESFMMPNKNTKRLIAKNTLADLTAMGPAVKESGYQLNVKKIVDNYTENVDMRDSEELLTKIPIRDIDRQVQDLVFKGIPFNPDELGGDTTKNLQRVMELHEDLQLMATYEEFNKQTSSELEKLALALGERLKMTAPRPPKQREISNDVKQESALLGAAQ